MHYTKTKNLLSLLVVAVFLMGSTIACGSEGGEKQGEDKKQEKVTIINNLPGGGGGGGIGDSFVKGFGEGVGRESAGLLFRMAPQAANYLFLFAYHQWYGNTPAEARQLAIVIKHSLAVWQRDEFETRLKKYITKKVLNDLANKGRQGKRVPFDDLLPEVQKRIYDQAKAIYEIKVEEDMRKNLCIKNERCKGLLEHYVEQVKLMFKRPHKAKEAAEYEEALRIYPEFSSNQKPGEFASRALYAWKEKWYVDTNKPKKEDDDLKKIMEEELMKEERTLKEEKSLKELAGG